MLLYGPDGALVDEMKARLLARLLGPDPDPFRRIDVEPDAARRTLAALADACDSVGFGGGAPVVVCARASEGVAKGVEYALRRMAPDARLIVTAGELWASSKLRKTFEGAREAAALAFHPPGPEEIERQIVEVLKELGVERAEPAAVRALADDLQSVDRGQMRRRLEVLALSIHGLDRPLTEADVEALAPAAHSSALRLAWAVARGEAAQIADLSRRLQTYGAKPADLLREVKLCFSEAHQQAAVGGGPPSGGARPQPRGPRAPIIAALAGRRPAHLERLLLDLHHAEADLRSGASLPEAELVERVLLRAALAGAR